MARLPWDTAPLPFCGIGIGWLLEYEMNKFGSIIGGKGWRGADLPTSSSLFILGFFLGFIPWYVGAIMLLCIEDYDKREKPGFIACAIAAVIATIASIAGIIVAVAILYHKIHN